MSDGMTHVVCGSHDYLHMGELVKKGTITLDIKGEYDILV